MNPRRPDAQDDDTNIVDEFGREKQKIIITDDLPRDPLQMFQSEFDQDETDPPAARLHIPEHPAMRPTASRDLVTLLMARLGRQRSGPRSVSTVSIVTISMILLGGALLNRGDVLALLDNLVFGRDDTSPVLEVRPPADVTQVAAAAPATNGTIDRVSARPSTPTPVTATKRPSKVQQPGSQPETLLRTSSRARACERQRLLALVLVVSHHSRPRRRRSRRRWTARDSHPVVKNARRLHRRHRYRHLPQRSPHQQRPL